MKLSCAILTALLDEKPHKVREFYSRVCTRINPSSAARCYSLALASSRRQGAKKRSGIPVVPRFEHTLEQQIEFGNRMVFTRALWHVSHRKQYVSIQKTEDLMDWVVQITSEGIAVGNLSGRGGLRTKLWNEVRHWYANGWVKILPVSEEEPAPNSVEEYTCADIPSL